MYSPFQFGAPCQTRTGTLVRETDFKSGAATDYAKGAELIILNIR